ncbi:MAG: T9SS type A sorting domain-containing protein [Ignavibacteriae bacterium]|nr:T9SS type A sorting domain-containing protein [Ignavibacteriota bacterium]
MLRSTLLQVVAGFLLLTAPVAQAQWEYACGVPAQSIGAVGRSGHWLFVNGVYPDEQLALSTDGGGSWRQSTLWNGSHAYAVVETSQDTIPVILFNRKVRRSTDLGITWVTVPGAIESETVVGLAFSRGTGNPAHGILIAATTTHGVYRSVDAGVQWVPSNAGLPSTSLTTALAIDSVFLVATSDKKVFRSVDNGVSWTSSSTGITDTNVTALAAVGRDAFAASGTRVYRSSDAGATWAKYEQEVPSEIKSLVPITTSATGAAPILFAVCSGEYYRRAPGDTGWTPGTTSWLSYSHVGGIASVDTVLLLANGTMLLRSLDAGTTWYPVGPLGDTQVLANGHTSSKNATPRLYSRLFTSTDRGSSWIGMRQHTSWPNVTAIAVSCDTSLTGHDQIVIGTDSAEVDRSTDGGASWTRLRVSDGPLTPHVVLGVAEIDGRVFASIQSSRYYHAAGDTIAGIHRTTDGGASWTKMNTPGLTDTLIISLDAFRGKTGGRVLFAGGWETLFRSTDDGATWQDIASGVLHAGRKFMRSLGPDLWLCTQGTHFVEYLDDGTLVVTDDSARVYRSTDDGVTWQDRTGDLNAVFVRGFAVTRSRIDPAHVSMAVCTDNDILTSTEGGTHWDPFWEGSYRFSFGAPLTADEEYVYAGPGWLRRRPWSQAAVADVLPSTGIPSAYGLEQNYPNPFNPSTMITYQLPARTHVHLAVFNILGQQVMVLQNGEYAAGPHAVRFDASGLPSGVYFYRLDAGVFRQTRKCVLVR